jgi:hypothetical protein
LHHVILNGVRDWENHARPQTKGVKRIEPCLLPWNRAAVGKSHPRPKKLSFPAAIQAMISTFGARHVPALHVSGYDLSN